MDADQHPDLYSFEPLSQRERDILALLAQNLSDREIADRLVLAYTTVKWYNRQIFSKLSVESRQQAVERAASLGLLASSKPSESLTRNFPALLTPFVGRVGELEDLSHLLNHPNTRFVTILAPGGMGKTRLALAAAETATRYFVDGVTFVPLAALASVDVFMTTIAYALGLQFFPDSRTFKQQILDFLRDKHILLVLDNFEHLLESGSLIGDLLASATQMKVLVTSRERLNLEGETIYTLGGLSYPERTDDENPLDYGAARLFIECARRANSHFIAQDEASIVRISQLVQGMPLALEMAAAWIGTLSPAEIADEIMRSADFLRTTMRNFPNRLRSVRSVFEATWKRMTDNERKGFRRLSIFRGGFSREAAQIVAGTDLNVLASLVDKALLWHRPESGRYEVHELLRQYAAEQLEMASEAETTRDAHRDYFGQVAHQWGKALKTPRQLLALDILDADLDNIREAFRRAIETGVPEVIEPFADLWYFYEIRTRYVEGEKLFGAAVNVLKVQDSLALARHLLGHALMHERLYNFDQEARLAKESIEVLRRVGATQEIPFAMTVQGAGTMAGGDMDRAASIWREALPVVRDYGDQWTESIIVYLLGLAEVGHKRYAEAKRWFAQSYALYEKTGNDWGASFSLYQLGWIAFDDGDYDEAARLLESGLVHARKVHYLNNICIGLNGMSGVALAKSERLQAKHFAEDALKISRDIGDKHMMFWTTVRLAEVATVSSSSEEAREHLREALRRFLDLAEPTYISGFGFVLVQFLAQVNMRIQAVVLFSFLNHHPSWDSLMPHEQETLNRLAAQIQSELPADVYEAAWEEGQVLTLDDLLNRLHILI